MKTISKRVFVESASYFGGLFHKLLHFGFGPFVGSVPRLTKPLLLDFLALGLTEGAFPD